MTQFQQEINKNLRIKQENSRNDKLLFCDQTQCPNILLITCWKLNSPFPTDDMTFLQINLEDCVTFDTLYYHNAFALLYRV